MGNRLWLLCVIFVGCLALNQSFLYAAQEVFEQYQDNKCMFLTELNKGDYESVKKLLNQDPGLINSRDKYGYSPLAIAACSDSVPLVKLLLQHNAIFNETSVFDNPMTALHVACWRGSTQVIKFLMENGADYMTSDIKGFMPITSAALRSYSDHKDQPLQTMLQAKVDIDQANRLGRTSLHVASQRGHAKAVDLLLSNKADLNKCDADGKTALQLAAIGGQKHIVAQLLTEGVTDEDRKKAFEYAYAEGIKKPEEKKNWMVAAQLLAIHHCANQKCTTKGYGDTYKACIGCKGGAKAYYCSVDCQRVDRSRHKLECGVVQQAGVLSEKSAESKENDSFISPFYKSLFLSALEDNSRVSLSCVLKKIPQLASGCTEEGYPFLFKAIDASPKALIKLLLEHKAEVDLRYGAQKTTALHRACILGRDDVVGLLISYGANTDMQTEDGLTPFALAANARHRKTVKKLVTLGANINRVCDHGYTALHLVAACGNEEGVNILINNGADVHIMTKNGRTALGLATENGAIAVVTRFLEEDVTDEDRRVAFENACRRSLGSVSSEKYKQIAQLLAIRVCSNKECKELAYGDKYKACGGCKGDTKAYYCGSRCQKADWKWHKSECKVVRNRVPVFCDRNEINSVRQPQEPESSQAQVTQEAQVRSQDKGENATGLGGMVAEEEEKVSGEIYVGRLRLEEVKVRQAQESEQQSKIQAKRVAQEESALKENILKEAINAGDKAKVEKLVALGYCQELKSNKWQKKLHKLLNPESAELSKAVHRKPETNVGKASRRHAIDNGPQGSGKVGRAGEKSQKTRYVGKKPASAVDTSHTRAHVGEMGTVKLRENRLLDAAPLSMRDRIILSGHGPGPVECEARAREDEKKFAVFKVYQCASQAGKEEFLRNKGLSGKAILLSHEFYGDIGLDIGHICAGEPDIDGGLHLDEGKNLENRGLLKRVASPFDSMCNGCYRAERIHKAAGIDNKPKSFFPSEWSLQDLQTRLEVALCDERCFGAIYEDKQGDTVIIGRMPKFAGDRDDIALGTIYFKAIIKKHTPGVIRTAHPITENQYKIACLKANE